MAITYLVRLTQVTMAVGHSFNVSGGNDIYGNNRAYCGFDLSGYADADVTIEEMISPTDGALIRTETIPSGTPPTPAT
jgi:hypothetical protein